MENSLKNYRIFTRAAAMFKMVVYILVGTILWGCATFDPKPLNEDPLRDRAVTQTEDDVRVSATVLSAEETEAVFDLPLYNKGIQPVWLEIENNSRDRIWFTSVSLDPNYFSPLEVAYKHHFSYTGAARQKIDQYFYQHAMHRSIDPGMVRSGFVYTNLEMGTKAFNLDVIGGDHGIRTFTFLIPVAGLQVDHHEVEWTSLYADDEIASIETPHSFEKALEALPCCTAGADGATPADPLNVVIVGDGKDILHALLRSGWDETAAESSHDPMTRLPWEFQYQPVKSLYLFNRPQDAAFRKSRSTLGERNQLRLWLSRFYYEGKNVWVGQISRVIRRAVWDRFLIAPDVDEARSYLLQDLWYSQSLLKYGYIRKADVATLSEPRKGLHNDEYFTDGLCLVAWVSSEPVSFSEVKFVKWETPTAERRKLLLGR